MIFQIDTSKGWTEAIIDSDCEFSKFEKIASIIKTNLNITFAEQLMDFDSFYLDFLYDNSMLCLHYNIYTGVSIFPKLFQYANQTDNNNVIKITTTLMTLLEDFNWIPFDNKKSIGTKGSEGGKVIIDLENIEGARITLEKECGNIPFAVTIGIYGLMFHTHFDSSLESANTFMKYSKFRINKVFELYNMPEIERNELWQTKHDRLIKELAEMTTD
ncbi:MAG: hypothetical protein ACTHMC_28595 [Pseudobacter sp.]|uniref:hypothetical protein n=1 Tax=Pseudobacter sp. TaxID=2045420 RepID=UPI003F7FCB87